ncbi:MAG: hypothetical protein HYY16_01440 [Planctomycetes bacterium]|nr:hypothetical protein [Planctomycetota bacterium]
MMLLILCLVLGGCSVMGPGEDGAVYWAYAPQDEFADYLWKSAANFGMTALYVAYGAAYVALSCGRCFCR